MKRNIIAGVVTILVILLIRIMYDIAAALQTIEIEFYVALIGGAVAAVIYNTISNWKKKIME